MKDKDFDETRATGRLANFDVDILHRRARTGDAELLAISLQPVAALEAYSRLLAAANPFLFWMRVAEFAWAPWLRALGYTWPSARLPDRSPPQA